MDTIAGAESCIGSGTLCGDGGPALDARFDQPKGIEITSDGTIYVTEPGNGRIRRIGPDGIVHTVASGLSDAELDLAVAPDGAIYFGPGTGKVQKIAASGILSDVIGDGTVGDEGDGGPAIEAQVWVARGLAVAADGSVYIADSINNRVRKIGTDGIITALVGKAVGTGPALNVELGPAGAANLNRPRRMAVSPDGSLYIADTFNERVVKVSPPLPGLSDLGDVLIASDDGSELYLFDARGRHEKTLDALTGVVVYEFRYVEAADITAGDDPPGTEGYLKSVTDRDGNVTEFVRGEGSGDLLIRPPFDTQSPFEQQTVIDFDDTSGYLKSVTRPGGEKTDFLYDDGLMTQVTDPRNNATDYTYTAEGRLETTSDPVGGGHTLTRTDLAGGYQVLDATAEGVQTTYRIERGLDPDFALVPVGTDERRTTLFSDGTERTVLIGVDESTTVTEPDGMVQISQPGPDSRFGMQAPVPVSTEISTPGGLVAQIDATNDAPLTEPLDPFSFTESTDTVSVNGREVKRVFDPLANTFTDTTPEDRHTVTTLDAQGRVVKTEVTGIHPTRQEYDLQGRVTAIREGPVPLPTPPDTVTRVTQFDYVDLIDIAGGYPPESEGQLKSITDAMNRKVTFEYDADVRVSKQILPDGVRESGFVYDDAGNVTQVIPPGRPAHVFTYTDINLEETYDPPLFGVPPPSPTPVVRTTTSYTDDGQVDAITRPDGKQIDFDYDSSGRIDTITLQPTAEVRDYSYDPLTGNLSQIAGADATLDFGYDGTLQTMETWSGAGITTASVTRSYDDSLRVATLQVDSETPVQYTYDDDDLLVQAGNLFLDRDPDNGLLVGTTITEGAGTVEDTYQYNGFGELEHYEASHNGSELLDFVYTRDGLGRIISITETKNTTGTPVVTETHYKYDLLGRLYRVCPDEPCTTVLSEYQYDSNGNRIAGSFNSQGTVTSAVYDDQDRLLELTQGPTTTTYTYTDNGELLTKTDPSGTTSYEYDQLGNLLSVTPPSGPQIEYLIDARNRRTGKKVGGVLEKQWIYQDQLNPVAELDGSGDLVSEFVYAAKSNVPSFIIRHDDPAPGQTTPYRVLSDHLGSVRVVGAIDGASLGVVEEIAYDEFGVANTIPAFQPFGFGGGLTEGNLVRFGARDYEPIRARWTAKDPIGFSCMELNLFEYAKSDPVNGVDSTGEFTISLQHASFAASAVLAGAAIFATRVIDLDQARERRRPRRRRGTPTRTPSFTPTPDRGLYCFQLWRSCIAWALGRGVDTRDLCDAARDKCEQNIPVPVAFPSGHVAYPW